jgi:selenocysteine lyase/cysteine desulfurase
VTSFNAKRVRSDIPQLNRVVFDRPITYLDTASTSLQPNAVIDAMSRYYQLRHANVHRAVYQTASEATAAYEGSRGRGRALHQRSGRRGRDRLHQERDRVIQSARQVLGSENS